MQRHAISVLLEFKVADLKRRAGDSSTLQAC